MKIKLHLLTMLLLSGIISFAQQLVESGFHHNNQTITLNTQQLLTVKLPSNPSTGYIWMLKPNRTLQSLTEIEQIFESSVTENTVGADGFTTIKFMPTDNGIT